MLTLFAVFTIMHDSRVFIVEFSTTTGLTTLFEKTTPAGTVTTTQLYQASFVCDDRKAAEIFFQGYINHEKRKL